MNPKVAGGGDDGSVTSEAGSLAAILSTAHLIAYRSWKAQVPSRSTLFNLPRHIRVLKATGEGAGFPLHNSSFPTCSFTHLYTADTTHLRLHGEHAASRQMNMAVF